MSSALLPFGRTVRDGRAVADTHECGWKASTPPVPNRRNAATTAAPGILAIVRVFFVCVIISRCPSPHCPRSCHRNTLSHFGRTFSFLFIILCHTREPPNLQVIYFLLCHRNPTMRAPSHARTIPCAMFQSLILEFVMIATFLRNQEAGRLRLCATLQHEDYFANRSRRANELQSYKRSKGDTTADG